MRIDKKIIFLKNLYFKIHEQCIVGFFNYAKNEKSVIFEIITNQCDDLLANVHNLVPIFPDLDMSDKHGEEKLCWDVNRLDEALEEAYRIDVSGLVVDSEAQDRVNLKLWDGEGNLYDDFQSVSDKDNTSLDLDKLCIIFEYLLSMLQKDLSLDEIEISVKKIFAKFNVPLELGD